MLRGKRLRPTGLGVALAEVGSGIEASQGEEHRLVVLAGGRRRARSAELFRPDGLGLRVVLFGRVEVLGADCGDGRLEVQSGGQGEVVGHGLFTGHLHRLGGQRAGLLDLAGVEPSGGRLADRGRLLRLEFPGPIKTVRGIGEAAGKELVLSLRHDHLPTRHDLLSARLRRRVGSLRRSQQTASVVETPLGQRLHAAMVIISLRPDPPRLANHAGWNRRQLDDRQIVVGLDQHQRGDLDLQGDYQVLQGPRRDRHRRPRRQPPAADQHKNRRGDQHPHPHGTENRQAYLAGRFLFDPQGLAEILVLSSAHPLQR